MLMYLRNYSADEAEIWYAPMADATLSLIPFSLKLIYGLGVQDHFNFFSSVCDRSSYPKFEAIKLHSYL